MDGAIDVILMNVHASDRKVEAIDGRNCLLLQKYLIFYYRSHSLDIDLKFKKNK